MADTPLDLEQLLPKATALLDKLSAAQKQQLLAVIVDTQQRQELRLNEALKKSLEFIPPFLRGPVRSLFLRS